MTKTLIIGGSRFLGPRIIELLQDKGHQVTIFNRGNDYGHTALKDVTAVKGDRSKVEDLQQVLAEKFDYVYDMCCYDQEDAEKLLRLTNAETHLIFLSTAAVYEKPVLYPIHENDKLGQWDSFGSYGTNKAAAEAVFTKFAEKHGSKLTIFRPTYLLGEDNYFDRENYYFSRLEKGLPILVPGNGNALMQFAFLEETAHAFARIPAEQHDQIEVLNIGGDQYVTLNGIVNICADIAGKKADIINLDMDAFDLEEEAFYDDLYPFPNLNFIVSNEKLKSLYGIHFMSLEQGLREIYTQWKKKWNGNVELYPKEAAILKKAAK